MKTNKNSGKAAKQKLHLVRINRRYWGRGKEGGSLWDKENKVGCCLGHAVKQITGCRWDNMQNEGTPDDLQKCNYHEIRRTIPNNTVYFTSYIFNRYLDERNSFRRFH